MVEIGWLQNQIIHYPSPGNCKIGECARDEGVQLVIVCFADSINDERRARVLWNICNKCNKRIID